MTIFVQYILKLSIALAFTWLFYQVFLRRLTFYTWNRIYLLLYSFIALFLPFVNIGWVLDNSSWSGHTLIQVVPLVDKLALPNETVSTTMDWVSICWVIGCALLIARLVVQQWSFLRLKNSAVGSPGTELEFAL